MEITLLKGWNFAGEILLHRGLYPQILLHHLYRASVMEQMHDGPVGGHFGVERTLARLKPRYFWYNMKDDVTFWCCTCISCAAKAHAKKTPQAAMGSVQVGVPMERIKVDVMGPLNETERHNRYILVDKTISANEWELTLSPTSKL